MSIKRKNEELPNPAKRRKSEEERGDEGSEIRECLENMGLDFDCAVAVWLHGLREMSKEEMQFLYLLDFECSCVSRCYKLRMRKKRIGAIFLFEEEVCAANFCATLSDAPSPHGKNQFRFENLGNYLTIVADIEEQQGHVGGNASIFVRNLTPKMIVTNRVLKLSEIFGEVQRHKVFQDNGNHFKFWHVLVSFKYAVQAFAAKLALDGKWIPEQEHPLAVEVLPTDKVKDIYREILKSDKMLFTP